MIFHLKLPTGFLENFKDEDVEFKNFFAMLMASMNEEINDFEKVAIKDREDKNSCDHLDETLTIRSDGNVVPCCYDLTTKLKMGNIMTNGLEEIWNNSFYINLRKSIEEKNLYQYVRIAI